MGGDFLLIGDGGVANLEVADDLTDFIGVNLLGEGVGLLVAAGEIHAEHPVAASEHAVADADDDDGPRDGERGFRELHEIEFHVADDVQHGQRLEPVAGEKEVEDYPRYDQRGEQAGGHADGERDTETFDRAGAHENEDDGRDERGDVRVEDGAKGFAVTGVERAAQGFAGGEFLADTLEDQHVGVHRHADGEDDAGDAGQRERGADRAHDAEEDDDVQDERHVCDEAGEHVIDQHETGDGDDAIQRGLEAAGDGVFAERRVHFAGGDDGDGDFEGVFEDAGELLRLFGGEAAADARAAAEDRFVDVRGGINLAVQHDGELVADVFLRDLGEEFRAL